MSMPSSDLRATHPPPQTAAALRTCRRITHDRARNFYYGLCLTPEPKRDALYALYAWMRRADDLADDVGPEAVDEARTALDRFRDRTETILSGPELADEIAAEVEDEDAIEADLWRAFGHLVAGYPVDHACFRAMLAGQLSDLGSVECIDFDDLETYCRRVASSVGRACIAIWGCDDPAGPELADLRGIGFQLTNILRDFVEDLELGRLYLPRAEMAAHGLDPERLRAWDPDDRCHEFAVRQIGRADSYYRRSAALDSMVHPDGVPTLRAMTRIYHGLLERLRRQPRRMVGSRRVGLPAVRKAWIAWTAWREGAAAAGRGTAAAPESASSAAEARVETRPIAAETPVSRSRSRAEVVASRES